ncbi:hypothetical protein LJR153_004204 [Paenibacillus sp. LjRoot153]|uniref:hypothetical protein n=1 Tax=Paenibacillus sp. LjRoot153 TaxID=3342270 RepID=UPI003ECEB796
MVLPEKLLALIQFGIYNENAYVFVRVHEDMLGIELGFERIAIRSRGESAKLATSPMAKVQMCNLLNLFEEQIRNKCESG